MPKQKRYNDMTISELIKELRQRDKELEELRKEVSNTEARSEIKQKILERVGKNWEDDFYRLQERHEALRRLLGNRDQDMRMLAEVIAREHFNLSDAEEMLMRNRVKEDIAKRRQDLSNSSANTVKP